MNLEVYGLKYKKNSINLLANFHNFAHFTIHFPVTLEKSYACFLNNYILK